MWGSEERAWESASRDASSPFAMKQDLCIANIFRVYTVHTVLYTHKLVLLYSILYRWRECRDCLPKMHFFCWVREVHQDGWSALCVCAPCLDEMMGRTLYILGSEPAYYTLMGEGGRRWSSSPGPLSNNMGPTNGSENATRRFIWKAAAESWQLYLCCVNVSQLHKGKNC